MNKMGLKDENPTRLFLLRHGEVEATRQGKYNGHSDVKLSPNGLRQFRDLAERLSREPVTAVYSSDLERSRTGAEIIAQRFGVGVRVRKDLREKHFGNWEGLTPEEVSRRFPEEWGQWLADPADFPSPGGESYRQVYQRVLNVLTEILKTHEGENIVIVAHGGVNRLILSHVLRLDLKYCFRIEQKFGALNIIDFFEESGVIRLINGP